MAGIFKAYDIRGVYGRELDEKLARDIGRAFVTFLKCAKVVIGRDMRPHSDPLFTALAEGINGQGADVVDLGLCSTPMSYFANGNLRADAGIMITASHNTGEWNGFKLSRAQAVPISGSTGIGDIERIVRQGSFAPPARTPGHVTRHDVQADYTRHVAGFADLRRPVRIVADYANAMGVIEARALAGLLEITPLYDELDGTFPHHEANPLKAETMADLQRKIKSGNYDFGVAFDGDADRAGIVDEQGNIVPMDLVSALIAKGMLQRAPGAPILYDLRSSWAVKESIVENGGVPHMCRVGHAFIKQQMRELNAVFAGEMSGHYYFRDNYFTESSAMAVLCVANLVAGAGLPLSRLVAPLLRYHKSPEINSEVADVEGVLVRLREKYGRGELLELDGLSVAFEDWWFNVRASNTEPLIRLNLEARTAEMLNQKVDEVLAVIRARSAPRRYGMNHQLPQRVVRRHAARYGRPPAWLAYAPGRAEILGNHTDYNGGLTLSTAVDAGICLGLSPGLPGIMRLSALDLPDEAQCALPPTAPLENATWANYVLGVAHDLPPDPGGGCDVTFSGDIPRGAGLSSSAALEVAAALALHRMTGMQCSCMEMARLCQRAENVFAGAQCGLLDQISVLYGKADCLVAIDFQTMHVTHVPLPGDCVFLLADTHVRHSLVDSAYNERRAQCEAAARFFAGALNRPLTTLREVTWPEFQRWNAGMDPAVARRARHVITENERVRQAVDCLQQGDAAAFGRLMLASHESSRDYFENSCPELDFLVGQARELKGVTGARLSGGGFGGSVVVMAVPDAVEAVIRDLRAAYERRFGVDCAIRAFRACAGARLL